VPSRLSYVAVLVFVLIGSGWLEIMLRTRVLRRWKRLLLSIAPVVIVFFLWDAYAVAADHWSFDESRILGIFIPPAVPLDEVLFFIVIPLASILTLEAVRSAKGWPAGDEESR
jgi:lycopene cyclase domain-containing protein